MTRLELLEDFVRAIEVSVVRCFVKTHQISLDLTKFMEDSSSMTELRLFQAVAKKVLQLTSIKNVCQCPACTADRKYEEGIVQGTQAFTSGTGGPGKTTEEEKHIHKRKQILDDFNFFEKSLTDNMKIPPDKVIKTALQLVLTLAIKENPPVFQLTSGQGGSISVGGKSDE